MSYTRVKDKIFKIHGGNSLYDECEALGIENEEKRFADNIDELCDCYLEDCGRGIPAIITKTMWVDFHMEKSLRGETSFYACVIKRDGKGTHIEPVAKLNEKGEMELL